MIPGTVAWVQHVHSNRRRCAVVVLTNSPFALFAAYDWERTNYLHGQVVNNFTVTNQKVVGGLRFYINEGTLLANDRKGTTLDIIDVLRLAPTSSGIPF